MASADLPAPAEPRMLVAEASRMWWVLLIGGIAWLGVAWIVLRMDITSIAAVGILIGFVFLYAAINEVFMAGAVSGGWKLLHYIVAVIFVLGAAWAFIRPINTFFGLASVLGLLLLIQGAFEITRAIVTRPENDLWWLSLISGILLILLAFWVSSSDRVFDLAGRAALILFWVGFMAIFRGFSTIAMAFAVRHAGKRLATP
jgi:uncharacterized membrane protein HdeD (DUF308 family)